MKQAITYSQCPKCYGSGICNTYNPTTEEPIIENPCKNCNGEGYFKNGQVDITEVMDELDWLKNKIKKILKNLNIEE